MNERLSKPYICFQFQRWLLAVCFIFMAVGARAAGGNYADRIDFGNVASEAAHGLNAAYGGVKPASGVGALGQVYREPVGGGPGAGGNTLAFNMVVDPARQNYLTVRLWGSDQTPMYLWLQGTEAARLTGTEVTQGTGWGPLDSNNSGGPAPFPNRFYYDTQPVPLPMTMGRTNVTLVLYVANASDTVSPSRPVYSAYTHTEPRFVADGNDPIGTPLPLVGQSNLTTLTLSQITAILQTNRLNIFGSGGYFSQITNRQIMPGAPGAPPEVIGGDLHGSWDGSTKTYDQWRDQVGGGSSGPGYTTLPDELISVLTATYFLPPFTNASGQVVAGLDDYHDTNLIMRIVLALDSCTYMQTSDGDFQNQANTDKNGVSAVGVWQGITSTPRAAGHAYAGSTGRGTGWSLGLTGADVGTLGWSLIQLLNDPAAAVFTNYLNQNIDADLHGGLMKRVYAYERMLNNTIAWDSGTSGYQTVCGYDGTVSQALIFLNRIYPNLVALQKLQAQWPYPSASSSFQNTETNDVYPYLVYYPTTTPAQAIEMVCQMAGVNPVTTNAGGCPGFYLSGYTNYVISKAGFGEAGTVLSGGYDGRYGTILPWLVTFEAAIGAWDPNMSPATLSAVNAQARATVDGFAHFISPGENYQGAVDYFTFAQEDYITYRDPYGINANGKSFFISPGGYHASDPRLGINSVYELRAAYLEAAYGKQPGYNTSGGGNSLQYLKTLSSYEATLRSLVNVSPASLTPLPGEPGQPNSAFVDPQIGVTAIYYNGERFYMNANWRNGTAAVSDLARIHDTTATEDRAALAMMPYNSATVQSDGNLSGGLLQPWVVRYGQWLIAGNPTAVASTVQLPAGSGLAIDLVSSNTYSMGSVVTVPAMGAVALNMPLVTTIQPVASGTYGVSNFFSKLVMNVPSGSTSPGTQMNQVSATGASSQSWVFTYNGAGYYTISNVASGLLLDNPSGATGNGTVLDQQAASGGDNQLWQLIPCGGSFNLVNKYSGLLADIVGNSTSSGALLNLGTNSAAVSQAWQLVATSANPFAVQPLANGTYSMLCAASRLALDNNASSSSGTQIIQNTPGATDNQHWVITYKGGGYYTVQNVANGLYLTDPNGATGNVSQLQQQSLLSGSSTNNQLWQLVLNGIGFTLINKAGGNDIDDPFGSTTPGMGMDLANWGGGVNQVWMMVSVPTTPTGLGATAGNTQVALAWTAASGVTTYNVKRATVNGGPYTTIANVSGASYTDNGLTNGTTYYYVVSMLNAYGESANSTQASATPQVGGQTVPNFGFETPTTATYRYNPSGASWTFTAQNGANGSGVTTNGSAFTSGNPPAPQGGQVGFLQGTGTISQAVSGFTPGINYTIVFSAAQRGNGGNAQTWNVQINGSTIGSFAPPASATNYTDYVVYLTATASSQTLTFVGTDLNGGDNTIFLDNVRIQVAPNSPATPTGLTATAGNAQVALNWPTTAGAASYNVKRATVNGGPYTTITNVSTLDFMDNGLANGTTYYYVISAVNALGETANSAPASATPQVSALATPTGLTATAGNAQVGLNWTAATGATSYNLKRATVNGGPYTTITNVSTASCTDNGLANGTTYYYVVSATNAGGETANSVQANATPQAVVPTVLNFGFETPTIPSYSYNPSGGSWAFTAQSGANGSGITANGSAFTAANPSTLEGNQVAFLQGVSTITQSLSGFTAGIKYKIIFSAAQRGNGNGGQTWSVRINGSTIGNFAPAASATNYIDYSTNFTATATTQTLAFVGTDLNGGDRTVFLDNVRLLVGPSLPTGLTAAPGNSQVTLSWVPASGATSYYVKRSTTSGGSYGTLANVTATNYVDASAVNGTLYYYVVSATNTVGESVNSAEASARPVSSAPPQISLTAGGGGSLQMNWLADHMGWRLQTQTNSLGTNWFTVAGSTTTNKMIIPIGLTNGSVFFRLIYP